jgi:hypothetical protein
MTKGFLRFSLAVDVECSECPRRAGVDIGYAQDPGRPPRDVLGEHLAEFGTRLNAAGWRRRKPDWLLVCPSCACVGDIAPMDGFRAYALPTAAPVVDWRDAL